MTSLQPRKPYTEEELKTLYPPDLDLVQVQVLLRHGERTPVSARFQNAGLHPYWPYCSSARHMRDAVLEANKDGIVFSTIEWKKRIETFGKDTDSPILATGANGGVDDICEMGMLTDKGRETTHGLGKRLRELYVDRLGFLPETIDSAEFLYLRSTPVPRALESLQQAFVGLYPEHTRTSDFLPPTILLRNLADEQLLPNEGGCVRFRDLMRAFGKRTAERWNDTEDMKYLNGIYGKYMPEETRVAVDAKPRLSGIMDTVNSTLAHGPETKLPQAFYDAKAIETMEKIGVEEWFSGFKESREYRALGMGSLLGDITARMVANVEQSASGSQAELAAASGRQGPVVIKFGLSGCHDTTLAGTLASLGAFNSQRWPPYTSHVAFEVFRKTAAAAAAASPAASPFAPANSTSLGPVLPTSSSTGTIPTGIGRKPIRDLTEGELKQLEGHYVRIRYNDEPVSIPGCKDAGKHKEGDETFCTLVAFKEIVDKFTPKDWRQECSRADKQSLFPTKPEPSGY